MAYRLRTVRTPEEFRLAIGSIGHYFGWVPTEQDTTRFSTMLPLERMHAVFDDGAIVAGAGVFPFEMTVPGGKLPCAGVTVVGVLPTHRRRGLLRRMMDAQLDDVREREEPIAALWASEETIYGRYGYGLASVGLYAQADRHAVRIAGDRTSAARLVDADEALRSCKRVYERVARTRPGMIARTTDWWRLKPLDDEPQRRRGAGPLVHALFERDGRPVGYALYRLAQEGSSPDDWKKTIRVNEAFGVDDDATRDVWRFLLEIDWVDRIEAYHLPIDHPLPLLVDRINKLHLKVWDGLWIRVVDVPRALAERAYAGTGRVTIEVVSDPRFPDNVGIWTIEDGSRSASAQAARPPHARRGPRVGLSGRDPVRAALRGRSRRGGVPRGSGAGRCAVRGAGAVVPGDFLRPTVGTSNLWSS